jgi:hypothetical protein
LLQADRWLTMPKTLRRKGSNKDHRREKLCNMAVTEGAGMVAYRLRAGVGEHESWMCVDENIRPVKENS